MSEKMEVEKKTRKKYMTFKERLQNPEYREKHMKYIMTPIECEICNCKVSRYYLKKHKQTKRHQLNDVVHGLVDN